MVLPYFSVIIPTFNRGIFLPSTIKSVISQSYNNYELIIVDDGSTDNTSEIIKRFDNPKVRYFRKKNEERGAARNFGIKESKGKYITFLDSDDKLLPNYLNKAKNLIDENPDPAFVHFAYRIVDENGKQIKQIIHPGSNPELNLLKGNYLSCMGVFVRSDVIKTHLFEEGPDLSGSEDWILWMRLASRYPLLVSNEITSELFQHNERSVMTISPDNLINRINKAGLLVVSDPAFNNRFSGKESLLWAHLNLYISLHLALSNRKIQSFNYLLKALKVPSVLFSRKPFAILKKYILK